MWLEKCSLITLSPCIHILLWWLLIFSSDHLILAILARHKSLPLHMVVTALEPTWVALRRWRGIKPKLKPLIITYLWTCFNLLHSLLWPRLMLKNNRGIYRWMQAEICLGCRKRSVPKLAHQAFKASSTQKIKQGISGAFSFAFIRLLLRD